MQQPGGPRLEVVQPQGAFYLYPKAPTEDDLAFCRTLLNSNVLVVPGRGFGTPGYFRISYCVEDWVLEGAVQGFAKHGRGGFTLGVLVLCKSELLRGVRGLGISQ
ncbi:MAG: hypothetical protein CM1200mP27_11320 [Chloroflexota bacterium]|nr:MAG: hypothetical protein CM1200mP27_11320 [Chloroflexota bacterium]